MAISTTYLFTLLDYDYIGVGESMRAIQTRQACRQAGRKWWIDEAQSLLKTENSQRLKCALALDFIVQVRDLK